VGEELKLEGLVGSRLFLKPLKGGKKSGMKGRKKAGGYSTGIETEPGNTHWEGEARRVKKAEGKIWKSGHLIGFWGTGAATT